MYNLCITFFRNIHCVSCRKREAAGSDDEEEGEVLQMRRIEPSATAPHLERIDERASVSESDFSNLSSSRGHDEPSSPISPSHNRGTTLASVELPPLVPPFRPAPSSAATPNSATSDVQSPRPDYNPEMTPLLQQREFPKR